MRFFLVVIVLSIFLSGCSQHLGNFTALSTSTYRGENVNSQNLVKQNAVGKTNSIIFLGIPLGGQPKIDQAVAEALSQNNGDYMTNGRLYATAWSVGLIGSIGYRVEGDVYKTVK